MIGEAVETMMPVRESLNDVIVRSSGFLDIPLSQTNSAERKMFLGSRVRQTRKADIITDFLDNVSTSTSHSRTGLQGL
jgi:hypothetical protein